MMTYISDDGRIFEKIQGSCLDCAGGEDRQLCDELPDCSCLIGERGEPVEACWKEVAL